MTDLLVSFAAAGGAPPASQELVRVFRDGRVRALAGTAWPGLGRLAFESVQQRDYNVLLGILFLSSLLVITANLVVDLVYAALDPRIELR